MERKKLIKATLIAIAIAALYLYLTHAYIYHMIGKGNLPSVETEHSYPIPADGQEKRLVYAALGDSLTAGVGTDNYRLSYPYLLAEKLSTANGPLKLDVYAYPGARTSHLIKDLLAPAIADKPDIVTVMIGTNDIHGFVNMRQFKENYDYILRKLSNETEAKIYILSIPYIGSDSLFFPPWEWHFRSQVELYNKVVRELAEKYDARYIDFAPEIKDLSRQDGAHYSADRFHPSAIGYRIWAEKIYYRMMN